MTTFRFFLLLLMCCCGLLRAPLEAQSVTISPPLTMRNDYGYEIIGRLRDHFLLFRDRYDEFEVQAYDEGLQLSWSRTLEDIERRGTQVLSVVGGRNDFSVIYKTRRRSTTYLRILKYGPDANLIDSMTVKVYAERVFDAPVLALAESEDRNCFVVYNKAGRAEMEATCFRLDKMRVLWDKKINTSEGFFGSRFKDAALSNGGDFFVVAEDNNRRIRQDEHEFQIYCANAEHERVARVPMDSRLTRDVAFVFDNENNRLTGAGLYGEKSRDRSNGAFYLSLPARDTTAVLRFNAFDDQFISIMRGREVEGDSKGIADAEVQEIALRRDGGLVLVGEQFHELQRGASASRGFMRDGARVVIDYYYNDLFAVALGPDGRAEWSTALHKKQYSQDDGATFSSFMLFRAADRLHLLFNDEIKYENTCSEYVLDPFGAFDRNGLMSTEGQSLRLRFRDGLQVNHRECLVPSEFRNKLRLVLLRY